MSLSPRDYDGETGMVHCQNCEAEHPPTYRLTGCDHPGCETVGCHFCLERCKVSDSCGHFCSEHLGEISLPRTGKKLTVCLRCEAEDAAEDEVESKGKVAA